MIPNLVILAGPTAVGKGTVSRLLAERYRQIYLSVSATTRSPREGEIDGVHYHFISKPEFELHINRHDFLEWAVVHGTNLYGTLKEPIFEANKDNRIALLEIDLQGARKIRETIKDDPNFNAIFIFLAPPTFEELITRLGIRGTESRIDREKRLETAKHELEAKTEFDHIVINDILEDAVLEIAKIIKVL